MNILERCPLCNSKEIELFIKSMDYSTSKEKFNIVIAKNVDSTLQILDQKRVILENTTLVINIFHIQTKKRAYLTFFIKQ